MNYNLTKLSDLPTVKKKSVDLTKMGTDERKEWMTFNLFESNGRPKPVVELSSDTHKTWNEAVKDPKIRKEHVEVQHFLEKVDKVTSKIRANDIKNVGIDNYNYNQLKTRLGKKYLDKIGVTKEAAGMMTQDQIDNLVKTSEGKQSWLDTIKEELTLPCNPIQEVSSNGTSAMNIGLKMYDIIKERQERIYEEVSNYTAKEITNKVTSNAASSASSSFFSFFNPFGKFFG